VSQDYWSLHIISAALLLQSSLVPAHEIELPDAELQLEVFKVLIDELDKALERSVCLGVIAVINVR